MRRTFQKESTTFDILRCKAGLVFTLVTRFLEESFRKYFRRAAVLNCHPELLYLLLEVFPLKYPYVHTYTREARSGGRAMLGTAMLYRAVVWDIVKHFDASSPLIFCTCPKPFVAASWGG